MIMKIAEVTFCPECFEKNKERFGEKLTVATCMQEYAQFECYECGKQFNTINQLAGEISKRVVGLFDITKDNVELVTKNMEVVFAIYAEMTNRIATFRKKQKEAAPELVIGVQKT